MFFFPANRLMFILPSTSSSDQVALAVRLSCCKGNYTHLLRMSAPSNSLQQPRVRHSNAGSPGSFNNSCRLHPIRATVPYQLLRGGQSSPTRAQTIHGGSRGSSPPSSPTISSGSAKQRLTPENRDSYPTDSTVSRGNIFFFQVTCLAQAKKCHVTTYRFPVVK